MPAEAMQPQDDEPTVKLSLIEGVEVTDVEATDNDGNRWFMDIRRVFRRNGKTHATVSIVGEYAEEYRILHDVEIPDEIAFSPGDILNPETDEEVPEGRRAVKIAAIAGIAGSLTLSAVVGGVFWSEHFKRKK